MSTSTTNATNYNSRDFDQKDWEAFELACQHIRPHIGVPNCPYKPGTKQFQAYNRGINFVTERFDALIHRCYIERQIKKAAGKRRAAAERAAQQSAAGAAVEEA
tara:strand:+ start:1561 stop:1872 length:312 start_codon:yes stop_codon:yes gene_type:complete